MTRQLEQSGAFYRIEPISIVLCSVFVHCPTYNTKQWSSNQIWGVLIFFFHHGTYICNLQPILKHLYESEKYIYWKIDLGLQYV